MSYRLPGLGLNIHVNVHTQSVESNNPSNLTQDSVSLGRFVCMFNPNHA